MLLLSSKVLTKLQRLRNSRRKQNNEKFDKRKGTCRITITKDQI